MIYFLYGLSIVLMLAMPLAVATWLGRRYRANWGLFGVGVTAFIASQIGHIPFNLYVDRAGWLPDVTAGATELLLTAAFLGLSAGVFEESARWVVYRWWVSDARRWSDGMMLGAGHGGVESITLGLLLAVNVSALAGIRAGRFSALVPAEQWGLAVAQAEALSEGPLVLGILPAVERAFTIPLHLSLSLLVMQGFVRGERRWWWLAVGWHAFANAVIVVLTMRVSFYWAEVALAIMALVSLALIVKFRPAHIPQRVALDERVDSPPASIRTPPVREENLDDSRYI
jgi:uncharacterized membrane protein YhfC